MLRFALLSLVFAALPALAQEAPDPARLEASVERLVSFGTRHTLSSADDPERGIGAARRWAAAELARIGDACDCIEVANIGRGFSGPRAPGGAEVIDVLGFQAGTERRRVVIVTAHIDSRGSDPLDATGDAAGADDDGSGVALVLEAARILSKEKFAATIVYALTSGEEQGHWGGELLAETAKERGWTVIAVLVNDGVGKPAGTNVADRVHVFAGNRRASVALAKRIDRIAASIPGGLDVLIDRRGGDGGERPFAALGYPAVRISGEDDDPARDLADRIDFEHLARVTTINVTAIRELARPRE